MKSIALPFFILLLLPTLLRAAVPRAGAPPGHPDKDSLILVLCDELSEIGYQGSHVSRKISATYNAPAIMLLKGAIDSALDRIKTMAANTARDVRQLLPLLNRHDSLACNEYQLDFMLQQSQNDYELRALVSPRSGPIYRQQVNEVRGVLKLIPPKPDHTVPEIKKRIAQSEDKIGSELELANGLLRDSIALANRKLDTVFKLLQPKKEKANLLSVDAFARDLFSISYARRTGYNLVYQTSAYVGVEYLQPERSAKFSQPGGFIFYGLNHDCLAVEGGLGYLAPTHGGEDVSWKCAALFLPGRTGIGLAYSPLTGAALLLTLQF